MKRILLTGLMVISIGIICSGCASKSDDNVIEIATKPMTEQFILSEMLKFLIEENTDLSVNITKGIGGGTANIHPALEKGDFDLYPEYTSTGYLYVMKKDQVVPHDQMMKEIQEAYAKMGLVWVGEYGFNNTFGLVVRKDLAQRYNLVTYSDLAAVSDELIFGAEYDFFEREDGYDGLVNTYDFHFKKAMDMDIGLKYGALASKKVDAMNIFTTDGQLSVVDGVVLEDDLNFYPSYYCYSVVRLETLEKYPELEPVLLMMTNLINESEMAAMNYEVEGNGREDIDVARDFLIQKGLLD